MGRTKNSGLSVGIGSSPQESLSQGNVDSKVKELARQEMINELTKAGVKFTKEDVIFVTKDKTGQLIWLEKGNDGAGLKHIEKHSNDFMIKHGVDSSNLVYHIKSILEKGSVLV